LAGRSKRHIRNTALSAAFVAAITFTFASYVLIDNFSIEWNDEY